ncbi:MAG: iron ABC transporter permease [Lentisphaerae bacterium]|nr:iron ABC transporter permease [Lentisphaerota bacterium]
MKQRFLLALLLLLTLLGLGACMCVGAGGVGWPDWSTAGGQAIFDLRLNRVLAGFVVGAALACSGVMLQALLRNPLADPYVLGVSSGAALGAAVVILTGCTAWHVLVLPGNAFLFALGTLALVYLLASEGGSPSIYGLLLSGVIVSSMCSSLLLLLVALAPVEGLHSVMWWMLGDLQVYSRPFLKVSAALIGVGCGAIWFLARDLNALTLGREMAHHLGVRTRLMIGLGLAIATLTTALAVSLAGLIGFVGLVVPHAMRAVFGPDHRRLIPVSALAGGLFLALCDTLARTVMAPVEIPVGVVTALVGGPFFLSLLRNRRKRGMLE